MSLKDAIEEVLSYADDPPPNESNTCEWVILPLLWAAGYARREIISRIADNNGQFPDYTMLPNTPECTWYAEAKAWNVALEDRHAQQSLNYANQNGKRWVVLTNGRVWRLYDNRIQGLAADKLIAEAHLTDLCAFTEFLTSVGKTSVCSGGLERYAIKARLAPLLDTQLQKPDSEIIRGLRNLLKNQTGLSDVQNGDIAAYFQELLAPQLKNSAAATVPASDNETGDLDGSSVSVATNPLPTGEEYSLDALYNGGYGAGVKRQPSELRFSSDTTVRSVSTWADLVAEVVKFLGEQGKLPPLPFTSSNKGNLFFLNSTPFQPDPTIPMRSYKEVQVGNNCVYVNTYASAADHVCRLYRLCKATGIPPSEVLIKFKP